MRNLLLSSFLAIALSACTFGHYRRLKPITTPVAADHVSPPKPIFGDNFNSFLFKTNITVYGKAFSGLLVTKQMAPQDYRVIFTTELGMKIFDFEFKDTSFTLHYCVPQFNRPKLLKTIQQDVETLLMNGLQNQHFDYYHDPANLYTVAKLHTGGFYNYYFTERESGHLAKIEHSKKRVKKTIFTLSDYSNSFPNHVLIKHCDIKLTIELNLLKK